MIMTSHDGPLHQTKGDLNVLFFFKLCLDQSSWKFYRWLRWYQCIFCYIFKQICSGKALKKLFLNLLLFDVGDRHSLVMAGAQSNFWIWHAFSMIYIISALNLRPGLNSATFSTDIIKFSAFKQVSFMTYTYNIQGWHDRTRCWPHDSPWQPSPMTATPWQPHSSTASQLSLGVHLT